MKHHFNLLLITLSVFCNFLNAQNGVTNTISNNDSIEVKEILFDPNKVCIQDNETFPSHQISTNDSGTLLLRVFYKNLQLWSIEDKKKMYDINFDNTIKAYLSHDGSSILIFELTDRRNNSPIHTIIKYLYLKTGLITSNKLDLDFFLIPFCFNDKKTGNWFLVNHNRNSSILQIDSKTLMVSSTYQLNNTSYDDFLKIPQSDEILYYKASLLGEPIDFSDVKIYNTSKSTITSLPKLSTFNETYPFSNKELIYKDNLELKIFDIDNKTTKNILTLDKKLEKDVIYHIIVNDTDTYILTGFIYNNHVEGNVTVFQFDTKTKELIRKFVLPESSDYFLTKGGICYSTDDGIFTYYSESNETISWNVSKTKNFQFNLTDTGYMSIDNTITNFKTLETITLPFKNNMRILLNKSGTEKILYVNNSKTNNTTYSEFIISNIENIEEPIWSSTKFNNVNLNNLDDLQVLSSINENYVIFYQKYFNETLYDSNYRELPKGNFTKCYIIDIKNKKVVEKDLKKILRVDFSEDEKYIYFYVSGENNEQKMIYNIENNTYENSEHIDNGIDINKTILVKNYDSITLTKLDGVDVEPKTYVGTGSIDRCFYLSERKLIVGVCSAGSDLIFWELNNSAPFKKINLGIFYEENTIIYIKNKLYIQCGWKYVKVINLDTFTIDASVTIFDDGIKKSMLWNTEDGYFKSSKADLRNFHFVKGLNTFPLSSYDLLLNRPDIIMQKFGFANEKDIFPYKEAYLKRLKRNGITNPTDILNLERPKISLVNKLQIPDYTINEQLDLEIQIDSEISKIKDVKTYVNGVPNFEENKEKITDIVNSKIKKISVPLHFGQNKISIVAMSKEGILSDPVSIEIEMKKPKDHKIYFIGIGVSKYVDIKRNLKYADKDIRNLTKFFSQEFNKKVVIDTLTNSMVTLENIKALKAKLEKTSVDDIVIISFSGHGMVDDKFNFYFGTHDIDFENPKQRGLSYEDIQSLLDNIPARRKLLLLDACHSGEFDNNEDLKKVEDTNQKDVSHRGSIAIGNKTGTKDQQTSFELMQSLFSDVNRGNGSYVISASGGKEFAFEEKEFNGGVFTYSLIKAMKTALKGINSDKTIRMSELKSAVYKQVTEITKGQQKPTSRSENIEWDWILD